MPETGLKRAWLFNSDLKLTCAPSAKIVLTFYEEIREGPEMKMGGGGIMIKAQFIVSPFVSYFPPFINKTFSGVILENIYPWLSLPKILWNLGDFLTKSLKKVNPIFRPFYFYYWRMLYIWSLSFKKNM